LRVTHASPLASADSGAWRPSRAVILSAFLAVYVFWGSTYLGVKFGMKSFPPFLLGGLRFTTAGLIMGGALLVLRKAPLSAFANLRWWRNAAISGGLFFAVANAMVSMGVQRIPSGVVALIVAITSVWIVLLDRMVTREGAPSWSIVVGMTTGIAGVAVLGGPSWLGGVSDLDPVGVAVVLGSTVAWATATVVSKHAERPPSLFAASAMQMVSGGVLMFLTSVVVERDQWPALADVQPGAVLAIAYLVTFGSLIGFTSYVFLLQHVNAAAVATYAYVNPLVAMVLGAMLAQEVVPARTWIAAPLILGAVALMQLVRPPSKDQLPVDEE
jgi:drug/metabolite transporter (DMT)-like permease